jgi:hypothetical protein
MALDDGLIHSESLLVDAPQSFGSYRPGNFDMAFNGPIGASSALRLSLNVPSVDLLQRVGAALCRAPVALRHPAALPAGQHAQPVADPGRHRCAAGGSGRCVRCAQPQRHRRPRALHR